MKRKRRFVAPYPVRFRDVRTFGAALLLTLVGLAGPLRAEGGWAGYWETRGSSRTGILHFEQAGARVTGQDLLTGERLEAEAIGGTLTGILRGEVASGPVELRLARDGGTFVGRQPGGGWWVGTRIEPADVAIPGGLSSPREALQRFLYAATLARDHSPIAWAGAVDALDFSEIGSSLSWAHRLEHAQTLFQLLDLTTIRLDEITQEGPATERTLTLRQAGSAAYVELRFKMDGASAWRLVAPGPGELATWHASLVAARGGRLPDSEAFRNRASPRDAMRAFLAGMAAWERGGRDAALAAIDLSGLAEITRKTDGETVAHTLRRAIDRIGLDALQSIPDDHARRDPFVFFAHPAGRIVLAPTGPEGASSWVFAAETVDAVVPILRAAERLPAPAFRPPGAIPMSRFFAIREIVAARAPALLAPLNRFEAWQVLAILLSVAAAGAAGAAASGAACALLHRLVPEEGTQPRWFRIGFAVTVGVALVSFVPGTLGVPAQARRYAVPIVGSVIILSIALSAWHLLRIGFDRLARVVAGTVSAIDDIIVSFLLAVLRAAIIIGTGLAIANLFSFSTSSILAGLGIGGLAVAFASRETLSNVFGAAILMTDRPFGRGDWISVGDITGVVEHVGIRSTRVRTFLGEAVIVPNGRLADSSIVNRGQDRVRQIGVDVIVTGGGTPETLAGFTEDVRARLVSDPELDPASANVRIVGISPAGIEFKVTALALSASGNVMVAVREAILMDMIRLARGRGLSLGDALAQS